ncbi:MAG: DUF2278 family protein [Burkholderiales bacterium]
MPLKNYGVLKGRAVDRRFGTGQNPHYQVRVVDEQTDYRIAVNVASQLAPSELEYLIDSDFRHAILDQLRELPAGWKSLPSKPGGVSLDFIRTNLFDPQRMRKLPFNVPGPDNDLNEKIDDFIQRAMADEEANLYAFGERWGPENTKDKIFGFLPGNGVHDIHMNQGNVGRFIDDDGVYQDGGLLVEFPRESQWVGLFLKFQSQTWHTDDQTGHQIVPEETPDGLVRIVAALVNAIESPEKEYVTLLNMTSAAIDLDGWKIADRDKNKMALSGVLRAGETVRIPLVPPVILPNKGGIITLLNEAGLRVDGVTYTKAQASKPGWTIKF